MKSIKQQYIDLQEGNMSQANFMRNLRMTMPHLVTNITSFDDSVKILRNKGILTEADTNREEPYDPIAAAHAEYTSPMDRMFTSDEWVNAQQDAGEKKMSYESIVNAIAKKYSYKVYHDEIEEFMNDKDSLKAIASSEKTPIKAYEDFYNIKRESLSEAKDEKGKWTNTSGKEMYDQFDEINNLNAQEVLIGIDYEIEKNHELTKAAAAKIVIKNLKKNPIYYTSSLMAGKEGYEPEYIGGKSAQPEARQMQPLEKNMGNVVDKKMGMQPVKGIEKPKKDADAKKETNKSEKGITLMSLIAKTVRGLKKMDATGEKMKKIAMKEARLNDFPGETPGPIAQQIMKDIDENEILQNYSDEITLQSRPDGFLRFGYWDPLPSDAIMALKQKYNVKMDSDYDEDKGELIFYMLTPTTPEEEETSKINVPGTVFNRNANITTGLNKLTKESLMQIIREELKEALGIGGGDNVTDVAGHQLDEVKLFADFSDSIMPKRSLDSRFARSISEIAREYEYMDNIDIPGYFDEYKDGDAVYAGPVESLEFFRALPNEFIVTNNIDGVDESFKITKTGDDSFIAEEI